MTPDDAPRYVWACGVCGDTRWLRDGPTLYGDGRYCPTCGKTQPIISFNAGDSFLRTCPDDTDDPGRLEHRGKAAGVNGLTAPGSGDRS